ncbi:hypothetical protein C0991_011909 [Blastosporella zonata]|nr:hypothetical protein C0991_011909 [Blastosporella zonata]
MRGLSDSVLTGLLDVRLSDSTLERLLYGRPSDSTLDARLLCSRLSDSALEALLLGDLHRGHHGPGSGMVGDLHRGHHGPGSGMVGDRHRGHHESGSGMVGDLHRGHHGPGSGMVGDLHRGHHGTGSGMVGDHHRGHHGTGSGMVGDRHRGHHGPGSGMVGDRHHGFDDLHRDRHNPIWDGEDGSAVSDCGMRGNQHDEKEYGGGGEESKDWKGCDVGADVAVVFVNETANLANENDVVVDVTVTESFVTATENHVDILVTGIVEETENDAFHTKKDRVQR